MDSIKDEKRLKQQALLDDAIIIYKLDCRCGGKHEILIPQELNQDPYNPYSIVEDFFFPATR